MGVNPRLTSGLSYTTLSAVCSVLLQFGQLSLLARMLEPRELGIASLVSVVLAGTQIIADFGLPSALVRSQPPSVEKDSSIFWLNIITALFMVLLLESIGHFLLEYIGIKGDRDLLSLMAVVILASSVSSYAKAINQREMRFKHLSLIEIFSAITAFLMSILAAHYGFGEKSIVAGAAGAAFVAAFIGLYTCRANRFLLYMNFACINGELKFSLNLLGSQILNFVSRDADIFIVSKFLGGELGGTYAIFRNLLLKAQFLSNPVLAKVFYPLLAKAGSDKNKVEEIFTGLITLGAWINLGIYVFAGFFSKLIIAMVLGNEWVKYSEIFSVMCIWAAVRSLNGLVGPLLMGVGRSNLEFRWNIFSSVVVILLLLASVRFGLRSVVLSQLIFQICSIFLVWFFIVNKCCKMGLSKYMICFFWPSISAVLLYSLFWFASDSMFVDGYYGALLLSLLSLGAYGLLFARIYRRISLSIH